MVAWARSVAVLFPAVQEDGGPGTICCCSVPCLPEGWRPWHVLQRLCSLRAGGWAVLARSVGIMFPARLEDGGPGTFSGRSVSCKPGGGWLWHVLQRLCSLRAGGWWSRHVLRLFCAPDAKRMVALTRSADILSPWRFRPLSAGRKKGAGVLPHHSCRKVVGRAAASLLQKSGRACCRVTPAEKWSGVLPRNSC